VDGWSFKSRAQAIMRKVWNCGSEEVTIVRKPTIYLEQVKEWKELGKGRGRLG